MFYHSLVSDWNHGNAHFLRGVVAELLRRGHEVKVFEPANGWSYSNLVTEYGHGPIEEFALTYPQLSSSNYDLNTLELDRALDGADVVLVHEWNSPELIDRIGRHRRNGGRYKLLFHDTHHRSVSHPESMDAISFRGYDGALVFGESLREQYLTRKWIDTAWVWHEAADTNVFTPRTVPSVAGDLVWVGNWGDEERSAELEEFLFHPVRVLQLRTTVHGVRYPRQALEALCHSGISYAGWIPNFRVPETFAAHLMTVHVPRRLYRDKLPGVPTIRVFEALACGIPLVCSPWEDCEHLFTPGKDFLIANNGGEMIEMLRTLADDSRLRRELAEHGVRTIQEKHTCSHRVDQLMEIVRQ